MYSNIERKTENPDKFYKFKKNEKGDNQGISNPFLSKFGQNMKNNNAIQFY